MIGKDRIQLNRRFRKVFRMLEDRGEIVLNDRNGRGIGDFAEKILGNRAYGHIIRAFLNEDDKRCIDYRHARALCREYGVNESYMIDGIGTPFGMELPREMQDDGTEVSKGNILFTTTEAFAGATVDMDSFAREDKEYFSIPGLMGGGLVAFPISGNSMEPVIQDGDIVICREISSLKDVKENKIYAVKNNGSLWVKYVQTQTDRSGRITTLKLISANHLEHDPFEEEVSEYTRIYEVIRRISDL
ncbi:MAG: S24 family peptidase [Saprospiraceae bacterium]|nr:S24 family peptidase [Saprospiraceae bacterium]